MSDSDIIPEMSVSLRGRDPATVEAHLCETFARHSCTLTNETRNENETILQLERGDSMRDEFK